MDSVQPSTPKEETAKEEIEMQGSEDSLSNINVESILTKEKSQVNE